MKAQTCPVCNGRGKVKDDEGKKITCHGCNGKGWITLFEDKLHATKYRR